MPPNLLPSYDLVVLSQASSPAWIDFAAPALGAAVGAALAGYLGYLASIGAGKRMVRQAKLEECILLLGEVEVFKRETIAPIKNYLRRPTTESAMQSAQDADSDGFVRLCERISILVKLHCRECEDGADKLLKASHDFRSVVVTLTDRASPQKNPDEVKNLHGMTAEVERAINIQLGEVRSRIEKEATTEKRSKI